MNNNQLGGRPRKPYRASWGEYINGLRRRPSDGRWVIVETGEIFSQPDERRAVQRFRDWESSQQERDLLLEADVDIEELARQVLEANSSGRVGPMIRITGEQSAQLVQAIEVQLGLASGSATATTAVFDPTFPGTSRRPKPPVRQRPLVQQRVTEESFWNHVRDQLLDHPEKAAERTGIPELVRLAELPKREPSPTLKRLGDLYAQKTTISDQERRESVQWWEEFRMFLEPMNIRTLRELTAEAVAAWGDHILSIVESGKSRTYARHRFGKVKTIVNFARTRRLSPKDCRHALDCMAVLVPPRPPEKNPKPISRLDLHAMLEHADDRLTAAILCGINLCLAPKEIVALKWEELDLEAHTFVAARNKTGVRRVGTVWSRTVESLQKLPRLTPAVFTSAQGTELSVWTLRDDWRQTRKRAGVDAELSSLRDGAYTAAIEAGATSDQAALLAGHAFPGARDNYVRRNPRMASEVCDAIERIYFG